MVAIASGPRWAGPIWSWLERQRQRWQRKPQSYDNVQDALKQTATFYRKSLWRDADCYVEIWLEKDALSGVVYPTTEMNDVPLMVARGYASLSFLHGAAEYIAQLDVPAFIYHLGDFDPSGMNAIFPRARPRPATAGPGSSDPTSASSSMQSSQTVCAKSCSSQFERHLPPAQLAVLQAAEESEREVLLNLVTRVTGNSKRRSARE